MCDDGLELDYGTMFAVMDSWEALRRMKDSDEVAGVILFKHFFDKVPKAKALFGFPEDMNPGSAEMQTNKRFLIHASYMIRMFDKQLQMLGPDTELLKEILTDLGKKHARMGVHENWFPAMGESLIETLRECLGEEVFTPEIEGSWKQVYNGLSGEMILSMNSEQSVLDSWAKLKTINDYDIIAGTKLFRELFRKCPETKILFGFPVDLDMDSDMMMKSRRFQTHAKYFIEMLDKALCMVEAKQLDENMRSLGELHNGYGVKPEFFPVMGVALIAALKDTLGADWNQDIEAAWGDVYEQLSSSMVAAMKKASEK